MYELTIRLPDGRLAAYYAFKKPVTREEEIALLRFHYEQFGEPFTGTCDTLEGD